MPLPNCADSPVVQPPWKFAWVTIGVMIQLACAVSVSSIWAICPGSSQLPSPAVLRPKASSACFRLLRSCAATKLVPLSAPTRGAGGAGGGGMSGGGAAGVKGLAGPEPTGLAPVGALNVPGRRSSRRPARS